MTTSRRDARGLDPTLPVGETGGPLALAVLGPGVEVEVAVPDVGALSIGRARDGDVVVAHPSVSRQHARLHSARGTLELEALAATNPVRLRGEALAPGARAALAVGEPFALGALIAVVRPHLAAHPRAVGSPPVPGLVVADPAMVRLHEMVARIAPGDVPVLVLGETGAGKEMIAQALHRGSPRRDRPLVHINCGALPAALVESELFGAERGAFTGADRARVGLIESASGGTVFLDEIGELPLPLQAALLRVLEEGAVRPVGATRPRPVDVRWVAATNRDLAAEAARGTFRKDLYYRLQGFVVTVPPLRERRGELRALAAALAPGRELTEGAHAALAAYTWPGNVRELRNALRSAALLAGAGPIDVVHLPEAIRSDVVVVPPGQPAAGGAVPGAEAEALPAAPSLRASLAEEERRRIVDALRRTDGNQTRAAALLGMPRRTLVKRLREYGIPRGRVVPE